MPGDELRIDLFDLISSLARVVDLMSPAVANHHMQVGYLAFRIAEELKLPMDDRRRLALAGMLHDIGAFSLQQRQDILRFETATDQHAHASYLLLKNFEPFTTIAPLVRFHHVPWADGAGRMHNGESVPPHSHILHLADRIAVLIQKDRPVLAQVQGICETVAAHKGSRFVPEYVEAFLRMANRDYIWLEAVSGAIEQVLWKTSGFRGLPVGIEELVQFSYLLCRVIDFKSPFTATHSSGVAASGVTLARLVGFSQRECKMFEVAAYLHDLGKLAIPSEILEKPGKLTPDERHIMRTHAFYTYQILHPIDQLSTIASWSSLHQERLNGTGYPFRYAAEELSLGARIMAVADVFTAVTEDRPYRKGMSKEAAPALLQRMADAGELDRALVRLLIDNFETISRARQAAQRDAAQKYQEFLDEIRAAPSAVTVGEPAPAACPAP
ncbi:MAG: HD domain-containing protein [Candidatus Hydrogenedentes bacterium]|nr:HD domain-containing protein [Candidatus Hydrogenedentota bacterium]